MSKASVSVASANTARKKCWLIGAGSCLVRSKEGGDYFGARLTNPHLVTSAG